MFDQLIAKSQRILVLQADNPDVDSLGSALALEEILGDQGKEVSLYCAIDMPDNVKYLEGWDRVSKDLPKDFDIAILVDCAFVSLLSAAEKNGDLQRLKQKPFLIIDHHQTESTIEFAAESLIDVDACSTGEVIYELAIRNNWKLSPQAAWLIAASILADTLGLTTKKLDNYPRPLEIMAELVKLGVSLGDLQQKRLAALQYSVDVMRYKGRLLERVEFFDDNKIATITIPYNEIREFSHEFNPTVILDELRMVRDVKLMIGFKLYDANGHLSKVTARIRCSRECSVAGELAEHFGGGGHIYAAGFKVEERDIDFARLKNDCLSKAMELLKDANK